MARRDGRKRPGGPSKTGVNTLVVGAQGVAEAAAFRIDPHCYLRPSIAHLVAPAREIQERLFFIVL